MHELGTARRGGSTYGCTRKKREIHVPLYHGVLEEYGPPMGLRDPL